MSASISTVFVDLGETLIYPCPPVERQYLRLASRVFPCRSFPPPEVVGERFKRAFGQYYRGNSPGDFGTTLVEGYWFWQRIIGAVFPRLDGSEVVSLTDVAFEHFKHPRAWTFYGHARETLQDLKSKGLRLALLSNWDRRARTLVENLDLGKLLDATFISSEVGYHKPDVRLFKSALGRIETEASQVCMIGNDVEVDLEPARRLGLRTLWFCPSAPGEAEWSPRFSSWADAREVISREFLA